MHTCTIMHNMYMYMYMHMYFVDMLQTLYAYQR